MNTKDAISDNSANFQPKVMILAQGQESLNFVKFGRIGPSSNQKP